MESVYYGRYELLEKIAAGGMAEVFKAKYQGFGGLEKTVVVKRILPQYSGDNEFVRMFVDEAKIAVALSHINLVQTFDFGQAEGVYYLAMEYVEGPDLQTVLRECHYRRIPIPMELSVFLAAEILRGLDYAHRRRDPSTNAALNIVHRDISPANILIGYGGNIKVADFGIAKARMKTSQTQHGTLKGKYSYMSPEQARGQDVDARSNVFSCGIILYELVTGVRPFRGKNELEILEKVKAARVEDPRKVNPHIPKRLADIIMKALTRDRNDRFQEAGTMSDRLSSVLSEFQNRGSADSMSVFIRKVFADKNVRKGKTNLEVLVEEAMRKPGKRSEKKKKKPEEARDVEPIHYAVSVIRYTAPSDGEVREKEFLAQAASEINQRGGKIQKSGAGEIVAYFEQDNSKSRIAQRNDHRRVAVDATRKVADLGRKGEADLEVTAGVCAAEVPRILTDAAVSSISAMIRRATMLAVRAGSARVLIGESVAQGLGKAYALRQVADEDGGKVFTPIRAAVRPAVERKSQQGDRTFGRDQERKRFEALINEVSGGRGRAIALSGEPGMGKSHLIHDLIRKCANQDFQIYLGRCVASGTHVPFSVFQEVIRDMVGLQEGAGPQATREGLAKAAEKYLSPTTPEALAPLYAGRVRLTPDIASALFLGMRDLLGGMALQKPVAVVVEDLHWADLGSQELLAHLVDHRGKNRILYAVTNRPEFAQDWFAQREIERVMLTPLTPNAMMELTKERLELSEVSAELAEYIIRRSRGNPFHLLEILRSLTEQGVLSDGNPGQATNRDDIATNQAVGAVVARERILNPSQREKVDNAKEVAVREAQGLAKDIKNVASTIKGFFGKAGKAAKAAADKASEINRNYEPKSTETDDSKRN